MAEDELVMDVCLTVPMRVDYELFRLWLGGMSEERATSNRVCAVSSELQEALSNGNEVSATSVSWLARYFHVVKPSPERFESLVSRDIREQFLCFSILGHQLSNPRLLGVQTLFSFAPNDIEQLICDYFALNKAVMRNIVGRRAKKINRSVNSIHEQTNVPISVCKRHANIVSSVFSFASTLTSGDVAEAIAREFRLTPELGITYMWVVFLVRHRFDLHRLDNVRYEDLEGMAQLLIEHWCDKSATGFERLAVDKQMLETLRDLRALLSSVKNTSHCYFELIRLEWTAMPQALAGHFASLLKVLLNIGSKLSKEHEFQDFVEDMAEQVMEPLHDECGMNADEMDMLFSCLSSTLGALLDKTTGLEEHVRADYILQWTRYLRGVKGCIWKMSHQDEEGG